MIDIESAILLLENNDIVALPTETVYGLAGKANSELACNKIYKTKGRPNNNPLIVHVSSLEQAEKYGYFSSDAKKVAEIFSPGPITFVVPKKSTDICKIATASLDTIAIRIPNHPIVLKIIDKVGPLAMPSANMSTKISPTTPEHVIKSFSGLVPVVDGGPTTFGLESTIVDFSVVNPTILRYGFITDLDIENILHKKIYTVDSIDITNESSELHKIKAPGSFSKHYSPSCPIKINAINSTENEVVINFADSNLIGRHTFNLSKSGNLIECAHNLYLMLQSAEDLVLKNRLVCISVAPIPNIQIGLAINDKLIRASK